MANERDLKRIARLKAQFRKTDEEIADMFGVSRRTIQRWMKTSEYLNEYRQVQEDIKEDARGRLVTMGEDILTTMHHLMLNAKSDFVRVQAASTLGQWLGLDKPQVEEESNEAEETVELLKRIADQMSSPKVEVLPPPAPGGRLPWADDVVDAEVVPEKKEEKGSTE